MRKFYLVYQIRIPETPSRKFGEQQITHTTFNANELPAFKLSWSHYLKLMRIEDEFERSFYEIECAKNNWSLRELYNDNMIVRYSQD